MEGEGGGQGQRDYFKVALPRESDEEILLLPAAVARRFWKH
jgi:hypothetical protein